MKVGIIGAGLMGEKRARAIAGLDGRSVGAVFDVDQDRAAALAGQFGGSVELSAEALVERPDLDAVVLAVPHHLTRDLAVAAFDAGKHVFCEKPVGRVTAECDAIVAASERAGRVLGVGFNYRHYPGVERAKRLIGDGAIGEPTHLRFVLGHAGRPGYEREWKTSKAQCGGGALLDPGIHVIDLVRFLLGPIEGGTVTLFRSFWELDVEDNAFLSLRTVDGRQAQAHVSITEWRNEFALDIFGPEGSLRIRGRSGFYGPQSIELTKRWSWLAEERKREEFEETFDREDRSFEIELERYFDRIEGRPTPDLATPEDARCALELTERLYAEAPVETLQSSALCPAGTAGRSR